MNKTVLGILPDEDIDDFTDFTNDEYNALFRTVEEFHNSLMIAFRIKNVTHLEFPELRSIIGHRNDSSNSFTIVGNPFLVEVSFPKLKAFRGIRYMEVYGNPRISDKTVAHLRGLNHNNAFILGKGDCYFFYPVESAAELSECTHITRSWNDHDALRLSQDFTGVVDTVIRKADWCIYVNNTSISDLSFLNFTSRGYYWSRCTHYITNNRNLCTETIKKMFSALNATVVIEKNKDPAECKAMAPPTSTTTTTTVAPPTSTTNTTVAPPTSTTTTTVAPPTSTTSHSPTTPVVHHYRGNIGFEIALQRID